MSSFARQSFQREKGQEERRHNTNKSVKKNKRKPEPSWPQPWAKPTYEKTLEGLTEQIEDFVAWVSPTKEECQMREDVVNRIEEIVRGTWPEAKVEVIGSCLSGLCVPTSDVDLVVFGIPDSDSLKTLYSLANKLTPLARKETLQVFDSAKVRIIKMTDLKSGVDVDISLSILAGKENTKVVQGYVDQFPLLKPLTLVIKFYLKQRFLNNPWSGGIGSYTLVIMIISYLQLHGTEELSLADLLIGFFELYGTQFDYLQTVISVTDGGSYMEKKKKNWENIEHPWLLAVEDPHNPDNDVGGIAFKIDSAKLAFEEAFNKLKEVYPDFASRRTAGGLSGSVGSNSSTSSDSSDSPVTKPKQAPPSPSKQQPVSYRDTIDKNAENQTKPENTTQTNNKNADPTLNPYYFFPDLAEVVWVNCHVQGFRQRIKQIYGENNPVADQLNESLVSAVLTSLNQPTQTPSPQVAPSISPAPSPRAKTPADPSSPVTSPPRSPVKKTSTQQGQQARQATGPKPLSQAQAKISLSDFPDLGASKTKKRSVQTTPSAGQVADSFLR